MCRIIDLQFCSQNFLKRQNVLHMKKREIMKKILDMKKMGALALGLMAFAPAAMAQDKVETSIGADIVSQYYWRGQDLGAVSLQPTLGHRIQGILSYSLGKRRTFSA